MTSKEEWKPVVGFEMYEVSNLGNVRRKGKNKNLKPADRNGYPIVTLSSKEKRRTVPIHRLVAEAFIPNPENKPYIDHCNTIKSDCRVENLSWVSAKENSRNPITLERVRRAQLLTSIKRSRTVYVYTPELQLLTAYTSTSEAGQATGSQGNVTRCCDGELKRYKGMIFSYLPLNSMEEREELERSKLQKRRHVLDLYLSANKRWQKKQKEAMYGQTA